MLKLVYGKNAVGHMISGKALARAVRGHFLVDAALNSLFVRGVFNLPSERTKLEEPARDQGEAAADAKEPRSAAEESASNNVPRVIDKDLKE